MKQKRRPSRRKIFDDLPHRSWISCPPKLFLGTSQHGDTATTRAEEMPTLEHTNEADPASQTETHPTNKEHACTAWRNSDTHLQNSLNRRHYSTQTHAGSNKTGANPQEHLQPSAKIPVRVHRNDRETRRDRGTSHTNKGTRLN